MGRMDQTIHTICRDAAERRFSELSRTKGRKALGRRTRITDAVYFSHDAFSFEAFGHAAGDRTARLTSDGPDAAPRGYEDSYLRMRRVLIPEWCRINDDQILREHNGAVIYTCPELAAENDMYSLVESGVNSGGSLTRGCIRCGRSRMYNMRAASDMKCYFDDAPGGTARRALDELMYGIRRGVSPAKVK